MPKTTIDFNHECEARGYKLLCDHTSSAGNVRQLYVHRPGKETLQLETVLTSDGETLTWVSNVSNWFNDNDTSWDHLESKGFDAESALFNLLTRLPRP